MAMYRMSRCTSLVVARLAPFPALYCETGTHTYEYASQPVSSYIVGKSDRLLITAKQGQV